MVLLINAPLLEPAIRRADRHGRVTEPDELARARQRALRASWAVGAFLVVAMPVSGYLTGGVLGATIGLVLAVVGSGLGLWFTREFVGR